LLLLVVERRREWLSGGICLVDFVPKGLLDLYIDALAKGELELLSPLAHLVSGLPPLAKSFVVFILLLFKLGNYVFELLDASRGQVSGN
jgi:hypothetical protein